MKKMIFVWILPDTFTQRLAEVGRNQPQPNDIPVNVGRMLRLLIVAFG